MARPHPVSALALALLALAPAAAPAQSGLRALHVDALSMRADRSALRVGDVFHLAIHVRVREDVAALDELVIPDVGTMHLLGDERHTSGAPGGTDVVETLTLEPTVRGRYTFSPAYLDAIDARTHRPSRFSSNAVTVTVAPPGAFDGGAVQPARRLVAFGVLAVVGIAVLGMLLAGLRRLRSARSTAVVTVAPPVAAPPPVPVQSARDRVAAALRTYRVAPAAAALVALRAELFAAAAAPAGATLRDALASTSDGTLRDALLAAERAAFGPAHVRDAASLELARATEAWLR